MSSHQERLTMCLRRGFHLERLWIVAPIALEVRDLFYVAQEHNNNEKNKKKYLIEYIDPFLFVFK